MGDAMSAQWKEQRPMDDAVQTSGTVSIRMVRGTADAASAGDSLGSSGTDRARDAAAVAPQWRTAPRRANDAQRVTTVQFQNGRYNAQWRSQ
ncbi:hypothetical protein FGB62_380g05 [Gracilaria domingensis]|nr:hypothetical protein FGB62_380g05 [Gracilaria domingensis]